MKVIDLVWPYKPRRFRMYVGAALPPLTRSDRRCGIQGVCFRPPKRQCHKFNVLNCQYYALQAPGNKHGCPWTPATKHADLCPVGASKRARGPVLSCMVVWMPQAT